jgi:hypothetical protein
MENPQGERGAAGPRLTDDERRHKWDNRRGESPVPGEALKPAAAPVEDNECDRCGGSGVIRIERDGSDPGGAVPCVCRGGGS